MPAARRAGRPPLAARTGFVLVELGKAATAAAEEALAPLGMRARDLLVLTCTERAALSQQELCALTRLDRTTMVGVVDALERLGLARRERSATDRRRHVVVLTELGARALRRAEKLLDAAEEGLLADLAPAERTALRELAERLLERVRGAESTHAAH
jgi:DNA-binding MarR family transcriptional regulator